ncbi:hypothetical protein CKO28_02890 [Rhodovibrio sodomensis]|uniref:Uncharacterized protein n=1 Tax=Rhodovibrio sodomensis TaxID=1088 RepID=A0ABS1D9U5_9PROT|nr:hypothetical protein [Rhodovibrio sodomensis]MBK1666989.1 hypothetical protein [Rhodovibrio sodomensis]
MAGNTEIRVTFAYLQDSMPENSVCAVQDVWFCDYLVWRMRGWVKPMPAAMAMGEFAPGFQLTAKGWKATARPRHAPFVAPTGS